MATIDKRVLDAASVADKVLAAVERWHNPEDELRHGPGAALRTALRAAGMGQQVLGSGHYGVTLCTPSKDVLKVCVNTPGQGMQDAYPAYALWAKANKMLGVPDIFYAERISDTMFVCAMPRYHELNTEDKDRVDDLKRPADADALGLPTSYLAQAILAVRAAFAGTAREDMHLGNFMYDPWRGIYVLTDPYAEVYDGDAKRAELECTFSGREYVPQIKEQVDIDFDALEAVQFVEPRHRLVGVPIARASDLAHEDENRRLWQRFAMLAPAPQQIKVDMV